MLYGAYCMIFLESDDILNMFRGAFLMYGAVKLHQWLERKKHLNTPKSNSKTYE
jgi:hypothetical protein